MTDPVPADELPTAVVPIPDGLAPVESAETVPQTVPPVAPPADVPPAVFGEPAREPVTCPECGTTATIALNRRESADFCPNCDFPLFWTPSAVLRADSMRAAEDALRRLPGTVGRATVASVACPHCAEPNTLSAQVCVRCGLPMQVVEEPPPPVPVYVPPPPVEPEPEPERTVPWWVWLLLGLGVALLITLAVLAAYGHLG